jgi:hypothetical protein
VEQPNPGIYFGASTKLRTDGSPFVHSYLRFNLAGLGSSISSARLRVYAYTANSTGYDVRSVSDTLWGETATNYNNAPSFGAIAGTSAPIAANSWMEIAYAERAGVSNRIRPPPDTRRVDSPRPRINQ